MHTTKRPLSFLLAVVMIVSMFAAVPFTASAAAVTPKYKVTVNGKSVTNSTTLPYTTSATNLKNKAGYGSYTVTYLKVYKQMDKIGTISGQNFTINKHGSEQLDIGLKKGSTKGHITPKVVCTPITPCVCEVTGYTGTYDGEPHTIEGLTVTSPESGATVKYGTVSGTYNLTEPPTFTDVGTHTVYYQVSASGWVTKTGSVNVVIQGNVYYVKQNPDGSWPADATGSELETRSGSGTTFNLTKAYEHYSVSGWSTAYTASEDGRTAASQGETVTVDGSIGTMYVYYSVDQYDLTLYSDIEGQTVWNTAKVGYGMNLSAFEPTVNDSGVWSGDYQLSDRNSELFTFGGWATEPGKTVWTTNGTDALTEAFDWSQTMPAQNVSLYPVWVANYIHVILDAGAWDQYNTYTQSKYDPATPVTMDQSQGRAFWKSTNITAASTDYDKYVNMDKMNAATRAGFTLDGWYTANGMKWEPTYLIAREYGDKDANGNLILSYDAPYRNYTYTLTLTARWKLNDATVTYNVGDGTGSIASDGSYAVGSSITVTDEQPTPPADTAEGRYAFKGWQDKNGALHQPGETIAYTDESLVGTFGDTNTIVLTAVYQFIPTASLNFDSQGGSLIAHIEQDVGTAVSLETIEAQQPTRIGYTFAGWYTDSACAAPVAGAITIQAGGTTIYAKWSVNSYTLFFDSKGGTAVESITQDYAAVVTAPADPTRTGYTFTGWDKAVPTTMPANDMTFNATWQVNTHTVTYDSNGGSAVAADSRNYGEFIVEPAAPTWEGHTFIRWDYEAGGEGAVSFPFTMPDEDVTLKAVWKENQTAPDAPAATPDVRTITLTAPKADEEYILVASGRVITDDDWTTAKTADGASEITFEGLVPHTTYDVYARRYATETKMPSPASPATTVTTRKAEQAAPAAPAAEPLLTEVVVDPARDGVEYLIVAHGEAIADDAMWTSSNENGRVVFNYCDPNTAYDVYARKQETDRQYPSAPSAATTVTTNALTEAQKPAAAEDLISTGDSQELVIAPNEVPEGYTVQYSTDGGTTWTEELPAATEAGTYTVSVKYVADDSHKDLFGDDITVTIQELPPEVQQTMDLIYAIDINSDDCKAKIDAARAAYDALSDEQKTLVRNYHILNDAEEAYAEALAAEAQDFMSVRIDDQIYIKYTLHYRENLEGVTVTYYDQDGVTNQQVKHYTAAELNLDENGSYVILAEVAPAQIGDVITVTITTTDGSAPTTYETSIKNYCNHLIANYDGQDADAVKALAKATLEYGQAANDYFAGTSFYHASEITTITEAVKQVNIDAAKAQNNLAITGDIRGKLASAAFMALTKPEFRFYMKDLTEAEAAELNDAITTNVDGVTAKFYKNGDAILLEVEGIKAEDMDKVITITVGDLGTITFSGNDFARMMANNNDQSVATLGAALYLYGEAAKACFA